MDALEEIADEHGRRRVVVPTTNTYLVEHGERGAHAYPRTKKTSCMPSGRAREDSTTCIATVQVVAGSGGAKSYREIGDLLP